MAIWQNNPWQSALALLNSFPDRLWIRDEKALKSSSDRIALNDETRIDGGNLFQNRPPDAGCVTTHEEVVKKNLFHGRATANLLLAESPRAQNCSDAALSLVWMTLDRLYRDLKNVHVSGGKSFDRNPRRTCENDGERGREVEGGKDGDVGDEAMDSVFFCVLMAVVLMGSRLFGALYRLPTDGKNGPLKTAKSDESLCSFHLL